MASADNNLPMDLQGQTLIGEGLAFIKEPSQLLLTGERWLSVSEINISPYRQQLEAVNNELLHIKNLLYTNFEGHNAKLMQIQYEYISNLMKRELQLITEKTENLAKDLTALDIVMTNITRKSRSTRSIEGYDFLTTMASKTASSLLSIFPFQMYVPLLKSLAQISTGSSNDKAKIINNILDSIDFHKIQGNTTLDDVLKDHFYPEYMAKPRLTTLFGDKTDLLSHKHTQPQKLKTHTLHETAINPKFNLQNLNKTTINNLFYVNQTKIRKTRGLINAVGELSKILFGTLTDSDLVEINNKLSLAGTNAKIFFNIAEEQMTLINTTHIGFLQNQLAIERITNITSAITRHIYNKDLNNTQDIQNLFKYLDKTSIIATNFRLLEKILSDFQYELRLLTVAWESLAKHQLNPVLFPPNMMSKLLEQMAPLLQTGRSLPYPLDSNGLAQYYKACDVYASRIDKNVIRIYTLIPLITPDRLFNIYNIIPLTRTTSQGKYTRINNQDEHTIAIATNGLTFTRLPHNLLSVCNHADVWLCPPTFPIYEQNDHSCAYAVFVNSTVDINKYCEHFLIHKPSPIFYNIFRTNYWFYNTAETIEIKEDCVNNKALLLKSRSLQGSGFIKITPQCNGILRNLVLPSISEISNPNTNLDARIYKVQTFKDIYGPPIFIDQDNDVSPLESQLNSVFKQATVKHPINLEHLKSLIQLTTTIWDDRMATRNAYTWLSWAVQIVLIMALFIYFGRNWFPCINNLFPRNQINPPAATKSPKSTVPQEL